MLFRVPSFADFERFVDLLKNKSRPEAAATEAAAWVVSEREMRERLRKEREARELKEKLEVSFPRAHIDYLISLPFWDSG